MNPIDEIDPALDAASIVVAATTQTDLDLATPCEGWQVRELLAHLIGGIAAVASSLGGGDGHHDESAAVLGTDHVQAFLAAAANDRSAWSRPDVAGREVVFGFGALPVPMAAIIHRTELVVHAVDLAISIGRVDLVDQVGCAALLRTMHELGGIDAFRVPGMFGQELDTFDDRASHRLMAYVGRRIDPSRVVTAVASRATDSGPAPM